MGGGLHVGWHFVSDESLHLIRILNSILKLFSGEERSIQDSFDRYPWSRNERAGRFSSEDRSYDVNRESKFQLEQLEQNLRDREMKKSLLRDILNWVREIFPNYICHLPKVSYRQS